MVVRKHLAQIESRQVWYPGIVYGSFRFAFCRMALTIPSIKKTRHRSTQCLVKNETHQQYRPKPQLYALSGPAGQLLGLHSPLYFQGQHLSWVNLCGLKFIELANT